MDGYIKTKRKPDALDTLIGQRLKERRHALGLSQARLGKAIGVSFQQVQKYERGKNRIAASTLYHIAHELGVPITWFFERGKD